METKNPTDYVLKELHWFQDYNHIAVEPHSPGGGGLFLAWKKDVDLTVNQTSQNFIDTTIVYKGISFHATFVYGEPDSSKRLQVWNTISNLRPENGGAWFLTGDFNEIIDNSEKCGGPDRAEGTFGAFRSFLSQNDLFDLKHSGSFLSWRGKRHTHLVLCRLDRALSNSDWADLFPACRSQYLKYKGSDHRPLLSFLDTAKKKGAKIFRFDRRLNDNLEIKKLVSEVWSSNEYLTVEERLSLCRQAICKWCKTFYENSQKILEDTRKRLDAALSDLQPDDSLILKLNSELLQIYKAEEHFWKQRSKQLWLCLGDSNTGYFHAVAQGRKTRNRFSVLEDKDGLPFYEEEQIANIVSSYYEELFKSSGDHGNQTVSKAIRPCITQEQNERLIAIP